MATQHSGNWYPIGPIKWDPVSGAPYQDTSDGLRSYIPPIAAAQYQNDPRMLAWAKSQGANVTYGATDANGTQTTSDVQTGAPAGGFAGNYHWNSETGGYEKDPFFDSSLGGLVLGGSAVAAPLIAGAAAGGAAPAAASTTADGLLPSTSTVVPVAGVGAQVPGMAADVLPATTTVVPVAGAGAAVPTIASSGAVDAASAGGAAATGGSAAAAAGGAAPAAAKTIIGGLTTKDLIALGGSALGGALGNKATQSSTPTLDPAYSPLQSALLPIVQQRLQNPLPPGFETTGVSAINSTYAASDKAGQQDLVRRGLARSPVAATADTTRRLARTSNIANFRAGIPLIAQELQGATIDQANRILAQGRGVTTTTDSGGGAGGAATNVAAMLGYLYTKGKFGTNTNAPTAA